MVAPNHASPSASAQDRLIISQSGAAAGTADPSSPLRTIPSPQRDHASASASASAANRVSGNPIIERPGENMTVEALDSLIAYLGKCIEQLQSTSAVEENWFQVWEEHTSDIPGFLKCLEEKEEVTVERIAKDTVLPALVEFFEGIGGFLHWLGFGCSILAWGIDKLDKQHQNFEGCLEALYGTVSLLQRARHVCGSMPIRWIKPASKSISRPFFLE